MSNVVIYKREDDPVAVRISMGMTDEMGYIVYRGSLRDVQKAFQTLYTAMMKLTEEAPVDPRYRHIH
jgi:hypothetical protein